MASRRPVYGPPEPPQDPEEPRKTRKPGRPTLIDTPAPGDPQGRTVRQVILSWVRIGVPFQDACLVAGVHVATAREWKRRGEDLDKDRPATDWYATFAAEVESARAEARARAVGAIREAFQGVPERTTKTVRKPVLLNGRPVVQDGVVQYTEEVTVTEGRKVYWQAGAWLLERTATAEFGRAKTWKDDPPEGGGLLPVPGGGPSPEVEAALESAWSNFVQELDAKGPGVQVERANGDGPS